MIPLSVNYSRGLHELVKAGAAPIQAIEFGTWLPPEQIASIRQKIPGIPFRIHYGNLIARLRWSANAYQTLNAYLACADHPWISAHISLLSPGYVFLAKHFGWYPRALPADEALRVFMKEVATLQSRVSIPIILENMPSFPTHRYDYEVDPQRICQILAETQTGFLLDLAHVRVAASVFHWDVHDYLQQLPLERTVQIHISGPRQRNGLLQDAHEPLQKEDYQLLEWVLGRVQPQVVTLEYYKDKNRLEEQLVQLSAMLSA